MKKVYSEVLKVYSGVLLVLISISIFTSLANGEISNNTSQNFTNHTYNDNLSNRTPDSYRVFVDGYHSFYRLYNLKTGEEVIYDGDDDRILDIYVGDTVTWSNEDPSESFTIVSSEKLWTNKTGYLSTGKRFSYTFNNTGMFDVYIRQSQMLPHQTIIVDPLNLTSNKTAIQKAEESAINKTVIFKKNESTSKSINKTVPLRSKITIKTYRRSKSVPGFESILGVSIIVAISMIYMLKRRKR